MASSLYVVQRTCQQCAVFAPALAQFVMWGWQLVIVAAAVSLPLGFTQGKEYAELEWPDRHSDRPGLGVAYAIVFFGTIGIRRVRHIYVANWFFGAFILAVALAAHRQQRGHPGQPDEELFRLRRRAGRDGAQWWYGHNAVGFFLTAGFLGMMYYFIPKQAERPVVQLPPVHRPTSGR